MENSAVRVLNSRKQVQITMTQKIEYLNQKLESSVCEPIKKKKSWWTDVELNTNLYLEKKEKKYLLPSLRDKV